MLTSWPGNCYLHSFSSLMQARYSSIGWASVSPLNLCWVFLCPCIRELSTTDLPGSAERTLARLIRSLWLQKCLLLTLNSHSQQAALTGEEEGGGGTHLQVSSANSY